MRFSLLLLSIGAFACGDDDPPAMADGGLPAEDLTFTAEPDPAELDTCTTEPPGAGEARAKHVSCEDELLSGTVAMGRVGPDIVMENAVARFIVRGSGGSASLVGVGAGGIVDAAIHGGNDLVKDIVAVADLFSTASASEVVVTEASGEVVRVRALFEMEMFELAAAVASALEPDKLRGVIDYELRADEPVLRVTVRVTTLPGVGGESFAGGFGILMGGEGELLQPFGEGAHAVLEGPGSATAVRLMSDGALSEIESISILDGARLRAQRGEEVTYELRVGVGATAADAFGAVYEDEAGLEALEVRGVSGDRIEIATADGATALRTRIGTDGAARVPLPTGDYVVRTGFGGWIAGPSTPVTLPAGGATIDAGAAASGTLTVDVMVEDATGAPEAAPVRVTVATAAGEERDRLVAIGPTDFRLPPGDYRITISRGLEHDFVQQTISITAGGTATISGETLARVVDTAGWAAGDFHLHSEMSTDSRHWLPDALRIVAAEGLDVVASTDHDFITDYDRYAEAAGVAGWTLYVSGAEVSHPVIAHVNGYPLAGNPSVSANGAPEWFMSSPSDWFDMIRSLGDTGADPAGALVQINHPRRSSSGLFESIRLDRTTGMATRSPMELGLDPSTDLSDFDVDAVEVWNKTPDGDDEESLLDYLALYALGRRFAMIGNSDTHDDGRPAGTLRTYVEVPDDTRGGFAWTDVADAIRARRATVSGGIFVTAEITSVDAAADTALVHVRVQAPPYVTPERLRVYAGTEVTVDQPLTAPGELDLTVPLGEARFVVVRVDGGRGDPVIDHGTIGMTNPIDVP